MKKGLKMGRKKNKSPGGLLAATTSTGAKSLADQQRANPKHGVPGWMTGSQTNDGQTGRQRKGPKKKFNGKGANGKSGRQGRR